MLGMKNLFAPAALLFLALSLSGCFFPGRYHEGGGYGGGYDRPPPPGPGGFGGGYNRPPPPPGYGNGGGYYHP
jgi:hypothetical protein